MGLCTDLPRKEGYELREPREWPQAASRAGSVSTPRAC